MANWKKLNKELDKVLNNLTDKELYDWYKNNKKKKKEQKINNHIFIIK